jgi:hypothetical protein
LFSPTPSPILAKIFSSQKSCKPYASYDWSLAHLVFNHLFAPKFSIFPRGKTIDFSKTQQPPKIFFSLAGIGLSAGQRLLFLLLAANFLRVTTAFRTRKTPDFSSRNTSRIAPHEFLQALLSLGLAGVEYVFWLAMQGEN